MKRLFLVILVSFFLAGCGTSITQSEFWQHGSHYKNWDHTLYSWFGYKKPTKETGEKSDQEQWWGIPIENRR